MRERLFFMISFESSKNILIKWQSLTFLNAVLYSQFMEEPIPINDSEEHYLRLRAIKRSTFARQPLPLVSEEQQVTSSIQSFSKSP